MNRKQIKLGAANRAQVRALYRACPGIKQVEIAKTLGISVMAVNRHTAAVRKKWSRK